MEELKPGKEKRFIFNERQECERWIQDLFHLAGIELDINDFATAKDVYELIREPLVNERNAALARAEQVEAERDVAIEVLANDTSKCPPSRGHGKTCPGDCQKCWPDWIAQEAAKRKQVIGVERCEKL